MNSSPEPRNPAIEDEASLWAAKLDGSTLSATDRLALDEWLESNPQHRSVLSQYCQFSADLEQQMPLLEGIKEQWAEIQTTPATAQPTPWLRWPLMAGVALTAAAAVAVVFWIVQPAQEFKTVATPAAKRETLTLADGSRVELNAQTNLQIEISKQGRKVRLASGEAFFSVHKDPSRPFTVETPTGSVRVTGTKFDVRSDGNDRLEVTVAEGSVLANPASVHGQPRSPVSLVAGDNLVASATGIDRRALSVSDLDDALAWRQGQVIFNGTPLKEVLACFARYHGRGITASPEVAALTVGAHFSLDDLDEFFEGLEAALPAVKVIHNSNGTIQVVRRTDP